MISMGDDQRRDELGRSSGSLSLDIEITSTGATRLAGLSSATVAARFPQAGYPFSLRPGAVTALPRQQAIFEVWDITKCSAEDACQAILSERRFVAC